MLSFNDAGKSLGGFGTALESSKEFAALSAEKRPFGQSSYLKLEHRSEPW
jgi:hypothetical protein